MVSRRVELLTRPNGGAATTTTFRYQGSAVAQELTGTTRTATGCELRGVADLGTGGTAAVLTAGFLISGIWDIQTGVSYLFRKCR